MLEDTATTEESTTDEETEIDEPVLSTHPYDLPGEWFVLNAQSGHEKKVKTNILTRIKNLHLEDKVYDVVIPTDEVVEIRNGKKVNLELNPAKENTGIVFQRIDLKDKPTVRALFKNVASTNRSTNIKDKNAEVQTIEHLMAAIFTLGIDNLLIKIDNVEVPILDGSSKKFTEILRNSSIKEQSSIKLSLIHISEPTRPY